MNRKTAPITRAAVDLLVALGCRVLEFVLTIRSHAPRLGMHPARRRQPSP